MQRFRAKLLGSAVVAASVAMATAASAADLPSRVIAPPPPPLPAFSWTGFYVGGNVGGDFLNNSWNTTALATGFVPDGVSNLASFNDERVRLGGYVGYNYQIDQVVLGVEGDGAYDFGSTRTVVGLPGTAAYVAAVSATNDDRTSARSRWDASVRARLGVTLLPTLLFYATGGAAFRDASYSVSCPADGAPSWCSQPEFGSQNTTHIGWTVGGGLETLVFNNLIARVEYRYSDYGHHNVQFFGPANGASGDYVQASTHMTASTVTVGLAYKFGAPAAPVVARY